MYLDQEDHLTVFPHTACRSLVEYTPHAFPVIRFDLRVSAVKLEPLSL